ncbi:MAG TPA: SRPBCC family protein [Anaerolineales bacterium]|nr:SRPBCC family protein [Anaerolineales bacterium]
MIKVEKSITINAPVEKVFAFASEPENSTKWQSDVDAVEYEGEQTVGGQYTEVRKFMGREMRTTLEITQLIENKLWAAKTLSGPVPYEVTVTYDVDGAGTRMTTTVEAEPGGFFKLAEGQVRKQLENGLQKDSQTLKEMIESM